MTLTLVRAALKPAYTIGHLYLDGAYFCDTIEDKDRGLLKTMPLSVIKARKVYRETAIPRGTYVVAMGTRSPKFSLKTAYNFTEGRLPRLLDVPGFEGILMHAGRTQNSSAGCIIVGKNKIVGQVVESMETFRRLWAELETAYRRGEQIKIEITTK